jgi:hypothetical protein
VKIEKKNFAAFLIVRNSIFYNFRMVFLCVSLTSGNMNWSLLNFIYYFFVFRLWSKRDREEEKKYQLGSKRCERSLLLMTPTHSSQLWTICWFIFFVCHFREAHLCESNHSFIHSFISRAWALCTLQLVTEYIFWYFSFRKKYISACLTVLPPASALLTCEITHLKSSREGAEIDWSLLCCCYYVMFFFFWIASSFVREHNLHIPINQSCV